MGKQHFGCVKSKINCERKLLEYNMALALFDLDETLIATDSDHAWGNFLITKGLVEESAYKFRNEQFFNDYKRGVLDINAYLAFSCSTLTKFSIEDLEKFHREFVSTFITPFILPKAIELIKFHRDNGDKLVVITSTNQFVAEPIVSLLGIDTIIAPEPEIKENKYTGKILGTPSFGEGKVIRVQEWILGEGRTLAGSYFYTDSHNDLPLLRIVSNPVAVDPDDILRVEARKKKWSIISLRD